MKCAPDNGIVLVANATAISPFYTLARNLHDAW